MPINKYKPAIRRAIQPDNNKKIFVTFVRIFFGSLALLFFSLAIYCFSLGAALGGTVYAICGCLAIIVGAVGEATYPGTPK